MMVNTPGLNKQQLNTPLVQRALSYGAAPAAQSDRVVRIDNQQQFNQLLQRGPLQNETIELGRGTYNVSKSIISNGGVTIKAADPNQPPTLSYTGKPGYTAVFQASGNGNQYHNLTVKAPGIDAFDVVNANNTDIQGVHVEGDGKTLATEAFNVAHSNHTTIEDANVDHLEGYGLYSDETSNGVLIKDSYFGGSRDQWCLRSYSNDFAVLGSRVDQGELEAGPIKGDVETCAGHDAILADNEFNTYAKGAGLKPGQHAIGREAIRIAPLGDAGYGQYGVDPHTWAQAEKYYKMAPGNFHGSEAFDNEGRVLAGVPQDVLKRARLELQDVTNADIVGNTIQGTVDTGSGGAATVDDNTLEIPAESNAVFSAGAPVQSTGVYSRRAAGQLVEMHNTIRDPFGIPLWA